MKFPTPEVRSETDVPHWAEQLVRFLDDGMVVPGTTYRVGFDALIGLIPGVGDLVTTTTSLSLVWLAHQRGLPRTVVARMLLNLGVDSMVGAIPVAGDVFDVFFKANRRNLVLMERHRANTGTKAQLWDGLFLALVVVGAMTVLMIPLVLAILLVRAVLG